MNLKGKFLKVIKRRLNPIQWGTFSSLKPVSNIFGFDRGQPIDRYYMEKFLDDYQDDIRGVVLEIGDNNYTCKFGKNRVTRSEILHPIPGNPLATIVGNLETGECIPTSMYDCSILTQTMPFIYDVRSVIYNCHQALKPGGILLATVPGISQISRYDMDRWGDYWRFTNLSITKLFCEFFEASDIQVKTYGNVKTAVAILHGLATEELKKEELDYHDPDYQLLISVRGVKKAK